LYAVEGELLILYYVAEFGRVVVSRLPACISYPIASGVGDLVYYFWPRGRRNMRKSLAAIFQTDANSPKVRTTARHCLRNFSKYIVDMLRYANSNKEALERDVEMVGLENLDAALKEGKGAIIVSFHLGNLDLGIRALSHAGYPVNAIVNNLESGQLDRFLQKPRAGSGVKLVNPSSGILSLLQILRRNEVIGLMIDSPFYEKGIMVHLGNKMINMPNGVAAMALRTGAKIIPSGLIRTANTKFRGIITKPIDFHPSGDMVADARELTQRFIQELEKIALEFPDQWYIFHPLIKDELNGSCPAVGAK
jgi:KDO2-lipid IV(A) lauroyltransferase